MRAVLALDVGTKSVRGALVSLDNGSLLLQQHIATHPITVYEYSHHQQVFLEQSSENIWYALQQVCKELTQLVSTNNNESIQIEAIALDATCSLVVYNVQTQKPVSISFGHSDANIILWACHRAEQEANFINNTKHKVLKFVGGKVSPEMEIPKLKWIQNNFPEIWNNPHIYFFDLADFLLYKLMEEEKTNFTVETRRSICTTTCKWNFLSHETQGWQMEFFQQLGMQQLLQTKEWNHRIGLHQEVTPVGEKIGTLSHKAAKELNLFSHHQLFPITIGMSIIDAHAGALGMLGTACEEEIPLDQKLVIICGTSNCHIALQKQQQFVPGIWGPYYSIMLPQYWTMEGGQSSVGSLLDTIIQSHPYTLQQWSQYSIHQMYAHLNEFVKQQNIPFDATRDIHILPYFNGNRSPLSDSNIKGSIVGVTQHNTLYNLVILYLSTIQSLCYETVHIVQQFNQYRTSQPIRCILLCGGLLKNSIFVNELVLICRVLLGKEVQVRQVNEEEKGKTDAMLVGSAMLAAKACGMYQSVEEAMNKMSVATKKIVIQENEWEEQISDFHQRKYSVYKLLYIHQKQYQQIMHQQLN